MARTLLALAVTLLAFGAAAQTDPIEFGRASGGTIELITKSPRQTSGSLSMTHSSRGQGYEGSIGGTLVPDRLWFFGAASILPPLQFSAPELRAVDAKATAQPVDWTTVTGTWSGGLQPTDGGLKPAAPRSFLSLRSTSMLSDRLILNISVSRSR